MTNFWTAAASGFNVTSIPAGLQAASNPKTWQPARGSSGAGDRALSDSVQQQPASVAHSNSVQSLNHNTSSQDTAKPAIPNVCVSMFNRRDKQPGLEVAADTGQFRKSHTTGTGNQTKSQPSATETGSHLNPEPCASGLSTGYEGRAQRGTSWQTAAAAAAAGVGTDRAHAWSSAQVHGQASERQRDWPRVGLAPESNAQRAGKLQALQLELQAAEKLVVTLKMMVKHMVQSMQSCPAMEEDSAVPSCVIVT